MKYVNSTINQPLINEIWNKVLNSNNPDECLMLFTKQIQNCIGKFEKSHSQKKTGFKK